MPDHSSRPARKALRGTVSVAVVLALSGTLFAANARLAHRSEERQPQDLVDLARVEDARVQRLLETASGLRADVDGLLEEQTRVSGLALPTATAGEQVSSGKVPVTGTGITVRLDDASTQPAGVQPDDLVIHQQDIEAVMHALWAGGAEAMTIMDQRVVMTTSVLCIGAVLYLHGLRFSPPYTIRAIGDPAKLQAALERSEPLRIYQQYVDAYGLGWSVSTQDSLTLPAYEGPGDLSFASVPDGTEVWPGIVAGARHATSRSGRTSTADDA